MAPSLPQRRAQPKKATATQAPVYPTLAKITSLASLLPPSAPSNSDLNPLADLVTLFQSLPLSFPTDTKPAHLETNRQAVHTALHALKAIFEALISQGRIHGVFKGKKAKTSHGAKEEPESDSVAAVKLWLKERWAEYLAKTADIVGGHWDAGVRVRSGLQSDGRRGQLITLPACRSLP